MESITAVPQDESGSARTFGLASSAQPAVPAPRSPVLIALAENVHRHRAARGWSFVTLGRNASTSVSLLKHIEKRRSDPSVSVLFRIANAFGVRVAQLVEPSPRIAAVAEEAEAFPRYYDPEALAAALGARVRSHRIRRNWDRKRFAEEAGISTGTIHYLETNANVPTTTVIERVALAFGQSFSDFVEPATSPVLSIVRAEASLSDASTLTRTLFTQPAPNDALEIAECRLESRRGCLSLQPLPPGSTIVIYVMKGNIRIRFENEEHALQRGDLFVFAAECTATISNDATSPASFLRIDRAHHPRLRRARE